MGPARWPVHRPICRPIYRLVQVFQRRHIITGDTRGAGAVYGQRPGRWRAGGNFGQSLAERRIGLHGVTGQQPGIARLPQQFADQPLAAPEKSRIGAVHFGNPEIFGGRLQGQGGFIKPAQTGQRQRRAMLRGNAATGNQPIAGHIMGGLRCAGRQVHAIPVIARVKRPAPFRRHGAGAVCAQRKEQCGGERQTE